MKKQKQYGERNNPTEPVMIQMVENVRTKPAYRSMIRDHMEWIEEDKKRVRESKASNTDNSCQRGKKTTV